MAEDGAIDGESDGGSPSEVGMGVLPYLDRAYEAVEDLTNVLNLSVRGIMSIVNSPNLVRAMMNPGLNRWRTDDELAELTAEERERQVKLAEEEAALARREADEGFPLLHSQALLTLCGILEAAVKEFAARWLKSDEAAWQQADIADLKVTLGEYEQLDRAERALYVVGLLEQKRGLGRLRGVSRFENILSIAGLSGKFDPDSARDIYEMFQVRNALLHRNRIVDRQLLRNCPWLGVEAGSVVKVTHDQFARYLGAVAAYLTELIYRFSDRVGAGVREEAARKEGPPGFDEQSTL